MSVKTNEKVIVSLISGICVCVAVLFLNHLDLEYILTWGISLLEHIHHGELYNYATDLTNMDYGTNYNLFQNANVALWCLLPYVISQITKIVIPILVYKTWVKIIIAVLHVCCARELYKIVKLLGFENRNAFITALLYYCSPIVMIHAIGIGQIDCLGILFFLISIRLLLEKKYWAMSFAMGVALLSKFFVVIFYLPLLLLNFDKARKTIKYAITTIAIPIIDKIVTTLLIEDYSLQADIHNNESFYPRLFHVSFNYESVFIMLVLILCGVCLMIGNRKRTKEYYFLLFPSVIYFILFLLVFWHPQWMMYVLPILLIMGCHIANEWEYAFFYAGFTMGFTLHSIVNCNTSWFNAILVKESLLGKFLCEKNVYIGNWIMDNISPYVGNLGYTIVMASFALLIILFYFNVYKGKEANQKIQCLNVVWYGVAIIPVAFYMILLLAINIL